MNRPDTCVKAGSPFVGLSLMGICMELYDLLWQMLLPLIKRHPRLKSSAADRLNPSHYRPADIWIQAASAGETKIAVALLEKLRLPEHIQVLVTTCTAQGMEILENGRKHIHSAHVRLDWLPFDRPASIARILDRISPRCVVLLETELWPGLLLGLKKKQIPFLILNARMSRKSFHGYRAVKFLWSTLCPAQVLAVSLLDASRFQRIFPQSRVQTMSNIKFSCLSCFSPESCVDAPPEAVRILEKTLPDSAKLTVFASIRRQEESLVEQMIQELFSSYPHQVIALFPRHMHRIRHWKKRLQKAGISFCMRSELDGMGKGDIWPGKVIVWDVFGEMAEVFSRAQAVFMGGSLKPLGGQNFLEPLLMGTPVVTGPYIEDFSWVGQEIFSTGIAQKARSADQAVSLLLEILKSREDRSLIRKKTMAYVANFQDGVQTACQAIMTVFADLAVK